METRRVDYTKRETWCEANLFIIAEHLGYVPDQRFADTLCDFIIKIARNATVTNYLLVVARNCFDKVTPPLEKVNSRH